MNDFPHLPNNSASPILNRPLVLVADDHEDNLMLISLAVQQLLGYSSIAAQDGPTTICLAQLYQPDLILLDIVLPHLNGIEVIHRLKQHPQTKHIPIVAVTALAKREDCDRILAAGCDDYISKPYMLEDLETTIHRYISVPSLV
ncbi:MAG TPA: response regulator [Leptolyngbyaceae cyanobacterium]